MAFRFLVPILVDALISKGSDYNITGKALDGLCMIILLAKCSGIIKVLKFIDDL